MKINAKTEKNWEKPSEMKIIAKTEKKKIGENRQKLKKSQN